MGLVEELAGATGVTADRSPQAYLGGSMVASVMAGQSQAAIAFEPNGRRARLAPHGHVGHQGHGGLRRSGFKTTPPDIQRRRTADMCGLRTPHRRALQDLRLLYQRQEPLASRKLPDRQVARLSRQASALPSDFQDTSIMTHPDLLGDRAASVASRHQRFSGTPGT